MIIAGLQKNTLIDYPKKIAATVFLAGCNFRCPFCYNSELVLPEKIKLQPKISDKDFFKFLKVKKNLLEGVVVCGGEPTINKDLPDFIKKIKKTGYFVKLDTNGSNPAMLKKLIREKMVDYLAMDIKASLSRKNKNSKSKIKNCGLKTNYNKAAGTNVDLKEIKKSIEIIKNSAVDYEFRITVVPGIHEKKDIIQIAHDISPAKKFYLQNFMSKKTINPDFEKKNSYSQEYLCDIQKAISRFFEICEVR